MKINLLKLIIWTAASILYVHSSFGQGNAPLGIGVSTHFVNPIASKSRVFSDYYPSSNWERGESIPLKFSVTRFVTPGIAIMPSFAFGNMDLYKSGEGTSFFWDADVNIQFTAANGWLLPTTSRIDPYIAVGVGAMKYGDRPYSIVTGGLGTYVWITEKFGLNLQTSFDYVPDNGNFLHNSLGLAYRFGTKPQKVIDSDGDGIPDEFDKCPFEPGPAETGGCPDTDGDGVPDYLDECPTVPGPPETNGCPDRDGDGVPDHLDQCPDEPGPPETGGCPDRDGDGIPDHLDRCPDVPGDRSARGCPDRDGDGVPDSEDDCPDIPGVIEYNGCPEPGAEEFVDFLGPITEKPTYIFFDQGGASLKSTYHSVMDSIITVLNQKPDMKIRIEGHADVSGDRVANKELSDERAAAVRNYFIQNGIPEDRLVTDGFGSSVPMSVYNPNIDRALNRRVEIMKYEYK